MNLFGRYLLEFISNIRRKKKQQWICFVGWTKFGNDKKMLI